MKQFTRVELQNESKNPCIMEHETLMSFYDDEGNYAFNEWWDEEGSVLFNNWLKNDFQYKHLAE